jgi:hypothetical protein
MKTSWFVASTLCTGASLIAIGFSLPSCTLSAPSTDAGPPGDAALGASTGTGCGTDSTTGATLCVSTTQCPNVSVDQVVFPECGFYITGATTYLACVCAGSLCPIGQPTTCAQAAALLSATNEGSVCGEMTNGQCTALAASATDASTAAASDAGSGCDQSCYSTCAGEPDCIQLCGC